jgi:trehalose/maltose hydrolase-like predicted phosphorylase
MTAPRSDVDDVQGGTTQEGTHMEVMAGTSDLIQRGYMGTEFRDGTLNFSPKLNDGLVGLSRPIRFRKTLVEAMFEEDKLTVATDRRLQPAHQDHGREGHFLRSDWCHPLLGARVRPAGGPASRPGLG